jgi:hypothetical protein
VPGPLRKLLRAAPTPPGLGKRHGVIVGGAVGSNGSAPPEYLVQIARRAGVDLDGYRWGLTIPVGYPSRKLVFHLFAPGAAEPTYVVKLVSHPAHNRRLEIEGRALEHLESVGIADGERMPRVAFRGTHAGLVIVAESVVEGVPFRNKSDGGATCPYAGAALEGLVDLGRMTRQNGPANSAQVGPAIRRLLEQFSAAYGDREVVAFLEPRVETLARSSTPLVFQHGDPGIWNILAGPRGRVGFLDWEWAEPAGLPLWDLFYFQRSYAVLSARQQGIRSELKACELAFLAESDFARWNRNTVARYCQAVGVSESLIEPLFYTCWMHRSIKEATRLDPRDLDNGHYLRLLKLCIRERDSAAMGRLFSLST